MSRGLIETTLHIKITEDMAKALGDDPVHTFYNAIMDCAGVPIIKSVDNDFREVAIGYVSKAESDNFPYMKVNVIIWDQEIADSVSVGEPEFIRDNFGFSVDAIHVQ